MNQSVTLSNDQWEDVIDFIGCTAFDEGRSVELNAYGIQLIESIKEQINES